MEVMVVLIVSYVVSFGNFLGLWVLVGVLILVTSGLINVLLALVGYGGLILIGFLMVVPNGVSSSTYFTVSVVFLSPVVATSNFAVVVPLLLLLTIL